MNLELRIPAEKCSKRVLEIILTKVQNENISVSEAFAELLDQIAEQAPSEEETPHTETVSARQSVDEPN